VTEKLFYEDSHMITFSAIVETCEKVGDYYEAVLNRTAFFPEGGGQDADTGVIGGVRVFDVQERDGIIYHKLEGALEVGTTVEGMLDWEVRFSRMQQHSGEHIVSGIVHKRFGYDNVGFHMGTDAITIDFNGVITKEELKEIERKANEAVFENLDVIVTFPTREELKELYYRSKIEIEGQVRLVTVPGHDACACCAPHVKKTGEIGLIKFVGLQNYKGGVRVSLLCGMRAIEDYDEKSERMKSLSNLLSAPECEVVSEVERLKEEISQYKYDIAKLKEKMLIYRVEEVEQGLELAIVFDAELGGNEPRELVNLLLARDVKVGAVFAGNDTDGYRYVIGSKEMDTRLLAKKLGEHFQSRGGGKPEMVQGSLMGEECKIREVLEECKSACNS
jgi:alanyl-tRNA synthetase